MVSASLPRPLMIRWGTLVRSLLTAVTHARTHGNRAMAAMELIAEYVRLPGSSPMKSDPALWVVLPSGLTSTSRSARNMRGNHPSRIAKSDLATAQGYRVWDSLAIFVFLVSSFTHKKTARGRLPCPFGRLFKVKVLPNRGQHYRSGARLSKVKIVAFLGAAFGYLHPTANRLDSVCDHFLLESFHVFLPCILIYSPELY